MELNDGWYFYQPFYTDIFTDCKGKWKKLIFLSTFLEIYSEHAVVYYYNYLAARWAATPPPCLRNHREDHWKQTRQRNSWRRSRVGGFGAFSFLFFLLFCSENIGEKGKICYYMAVFVIVLIICFLYVVWCWCV